MDRWGLVRYRQKIWSGQDGILAPFPPTSADVVKTNKMSDPGLIRYIQKFYSMRTQLQAISLRIQTVRSNEQMMQSMKGATSLLGSMNRQMNLPALQRIAMEFEKENDVMDQRQEMMDDAIDDVTGLEDEEEGEEVVKEVLDEIGVDLGQAVGYCSATTFTIVARAEHPLLIRCCRWERRLRVYREVRFLMGGLLKQ